MYTADDARENDQDELDRRIRAAVKDAGGGNSTTMRVYCEDWFLGTIEYELERRGFKNIDVPDIILKGDVYFEW
jgi:hypothetical protein